MMKASTKSIFLFLALGLLSLGVAIALWNQAFPTAALNFKLGRPEARAKMESWLKTHKIDLRGYHSAVEFEEDGDVKNYLELQFGLPALENYIHRGVSVWAWSGRWFKPEQEEEFRVAFDPEGRLVAYYHKIEEKRALPELTEAQALELASNFLRANITQHSFERLRFIESSRSQKSNRIDYSFTWERKDFQLGEGSYRIVVDVYGDEIGKYGEFLKIPESWSRDFQSKRKTNDFLFSIANFAAIPLYLSTGVLLILYLYQKRLNKHAFPWSWVVLLLAINFISCINEIPSAIVQYETTEKWGVFILKLVSNIIKSTISSTIPLWLLVIIANTLYREMLPQHVPFATFFHLKGLQYRQTIRSIALGVVFACVSFGYVCLFYTVGKKWGVWSPVDIDYSKTLSGWFPWVSGMQVGMSAALLEEMLFRVIGILIYWKLFRSKWLAIVLAGASWAFLHSNYPQMPGYVRGLELTVEGTLWGFVMLRYGVLTTLVAHYLFDCGLDSLIVFQSPGWINRIGAVLATFWPVMFGLYGYWKYGTKREYIPEPEIAKATETTKPAFHWWESPSHVWNEAANAFTLKKRWYYAGFAVLVFILISVIEVPSDVMNDRLGELDLSRNQIEAKADEILVEHGRIPATFNRTTSLSSKSIESEYYLEHGGTLASLTGLFEKEWPDLIWTVRYFKFLEREEFRLQLNKHGKLYSYNHLIPEESEGASLGKDQALQLAKQTLTTQHGVQIQNEKVVEDFMQKQPHRIDYAFGLDRIGWNVGDSKLRTEIEVQGNEVINFDRYIKAPEDWVREKEATGWRDAVFDEISSWFSIIWMIMLGLLCVLMIRKNIIPWKLGFILATIPLLFQVFSSLNNLLEFYQFYSTTTPKTYFLWSRGGSILESFLIVYLSNVIKLSVVMGMMNWAFGWKIQNVILWPKDTRERGEFWLNSFISAMFGVAAFAALDFFENLAFGTFIPKRAAVFDYPHLNSFLPCVDSLTSAFQSGFSQILSTGIVLAGLVILYRKIPRTIFVLALFIPLLDAFGEKSIREFVVTAFFKEGHWLITLALVWRLWRFNVLAFFLSMMFYEILGEITIFLTKGGPYQLQAIPLILVVIVPILIWVLSQGGYFQSKSQQTIH